MSAIIIGEMQNNYSDEEINVAKMFVKFEFQPTPPCPQCPYKLGLVHTVDNPCPQCRKHGYQTFERFSKRFPEKSENRQHL